MFSKAALFTLAVGALSANALAVPVARSPAPQPESWSEWGKNIGHHYANKYKSPSAVPGLLQFKREPGMWAQLDQVLGDPEARPRENSKRQLETLVDWLHHVKTSSSGLDDDKDAHHDSKREPSPEVENWEEWGDNLIATIYANKYGTPNQVPGIPSPGSNSKREHHNHPSPDSVPGDRHPGKSDRHHHKGDHHHGHENSKHDPSKTTTPTSTPSQVPSPRP